MIFGIYKSSSGSFFFCCRDLFFMSIKRASVAKKTFIVYNKMIWYVLLWPYILTKGARA